MAVWSRASPFRAENTAVGRVGIRMSKDHDEVQVFRDPLQKGLFLKAWRLMAVTHWHRQSGNHPVRWKTVQQKINITDWDDLNLQSSRPTDCMRIQYNILRSILGHWRPFRRCNSAYFTFNYNFFFLLWNNSIATLTFMQHLMMKAHWFIHISLITAGFCGFAHFASH